MSDLFGGETDNINVISRGDGWVSIAYPADRRSRLRAVGAFDMSNRDILGTAIEAAATRGPDLVEIDFRDVRFIDAGVVRTLLEHRDTLSGLGCALRVVGATGLPAMVLDLTRTRGDLCGSPGRE